jgi:hypothetical protein
MPREIFGPSVEIHKIGLGLGGEEAHIIIGHKIHQHFQFQDPPKYTEVGFLGMKINRLEILPGRRRRCGRRRAPAWPPRRR